MSRMRIVTSSGVEDVEVRAGEAKSTVSSYWRAVDHYLRTGETDELEQFSGTRIGGRRLLTDRDEIERLAAIGELDIEDIYVEIA